MKICKVILSIILASVLTFSCVGSVVYAQEVTQKNDSLTVKMINYNVAGLPKFGGTDGAGNTAAIAKYINANGFDIVAVQEDFSYHSSLINNLDGYDYQTNHSGNIPGGDGLNVFTKDMPIFNEHREQWIASFGNIAEGDLLTPKGLIHTVIYVGDGIYIDFYNIHADAFDTLGSRIARESNYRQIMALVEQNRIKYNRPAIITGDFNHFLHTTPDINSNMFSIFHEQAGFLDAWVEHHNEGNYSDFTKWFESGLSYWGYWDSVEKFLYKNGGGVEIEVVDFKYTWVKNDAGEDVSDHAAAECTLKFTKTDEFVESDATDLEVVTQSPFRNIINMIKWIFKDLVYVFSNFDQLIEMINQ